MKITITVAVVLVLVAAGAYFLDLFPTTTRPSQNAKVKEVPLPTPTPTPTPAPIPGPTPAPIPPPSPPPPTVKNVKFEFAVTEISGSGLSRAISAQLTNTGTDDAHDVWGKVEVFSQDSRVKLGGKDYLRVDIGTLKAGATTTKQVILEFSVLDGVKMSQHGARFALTMYSDENTETLYYDYQP